MEQLRVDTGIVMNKDAAKSISFKKIVNISWVMIYVILFLLYVVTQWIVVRQSTRNVEKSIKLSVASSESAIESSLEMIDNYLYESYYLKSPSSLEKLCYTYIYSDNNVDRAAAIDSLSRVVQSIPSWTDNISFVMMYIIDDKDGMWLNAGDSDTYQVRSSISKTIENHESGSALSDVNRYMVYEDGGKKYLLRIMKFDKCYFVIGISEKSIESLMQKSHYSDQSISFAVDESDEIIFTDSPVDGQIAYENDGEYVKLNGRQYLQVGYKSANTGYYFGILTDKSSIIKDLSWIMYSFVFVLIFAIILFFVSRYLVVKYIERPVTDVTRKMSEIEEGDLDATVSTNTIITEFETLAKSFNRMIEKIKALKIEKYESELRTQKATMQYLQLQIKPHFYANLLNIIYSLAQSRDYETIQRVSRAIVSYSRYMFRDATELVELKREIEFLDCYMEIQEIRYRKQIKLELSADEEIKEALVPPFVIQSFVENSVKYAFSTKKDCLIRVSVKLSDDKESMVIEVKDNGDGYPEELLQRNWKKNRLEGHEGLYNVYTRLQIIYEDKADIELSNDDGARTVITLPYIDMNFTDDI